MAPSPTWYIGLMSGTSLDGLDGVLCGFDADGRLTGVRAHLHRPFDAGLRDALFALQRSGPDECHRMAQAANALALACGDLALALCDAAGLPPRDVRAIGVHGQTIRHQPPGAGAPLGSGYTVQLNQPALVAERTGIDVIADFRSRDVAAGGQGAPLVPPFHQALFARADRSLAVVNLGGIGNVTLLDPAQPLTGFDCGPGNALLDLWCERHTGQPYDDAGHWAASGRVHEGLLQALLREPFFALPPPKSTGRDLFHADWLDGHLAAWPGLPPADVQATLAELTARGVADALRGRGVQALHVCGGGAFNLDLLERLRRLLPGVEVDTTAAHGLPPLQVEAAAFAWLACRHVQRRPGNAASVTGARGPRVLGACYPA
jgi:anhydro-N-acetylmuramic acid kinase